jgi:hypothetical protein
MTDREYRHDVDDDETGYRPRVETKEEEHDDSVLIFDFLKRKRPFPSARRLDIMLCVALCQVQGAH